MLFHIFQCVCLYLFLSEVSGLPRCGEFDKEQIFIKSDKLPFQDEFGELLRNFNESETGQIERISEILKNINPFVSNFDGNAGLEDVTENRVNFVVSPKKPGICDILIIKSKSMWTRLTIQSSFAAR